MSKAAELSRTLMPSSETIMSVLFVIIPTGLLAQSQREAVIQGKVLDKQGEPVPSAYVKAKPASISATANLDGRFILSGVSYGTCTITVQSLGFKTAKKTIKVDTDTVNLEVVLQEEQVSLNEVTITGKSIEQETEETGYAVDVIETEDYKNSSSNLNGVLEKSPGINIREQGGLGSSFKLSLNGLSGNQVRYFIDGVPMENFGSALTLNNYPANLIERIEVYKGVVPVTLGADALGGAVNIITGFKEKSFLDASYSYGSFNTHKASLTGQYADKDKGYYVRLSSFFNHSDNDYVMDSVPLYGTEFGNYKGTISKRRFHSEYTSGMARVEAGVFDKSYADEWSVNLTYAKNRNNRQHAENNITRVFGKFHTRNQSMLASSVYKKSIEALDVKAYVLGGKVSETVVDTSTRVYNWAGNSVKREPNDPKGELYQRRSLLVIKDKILRSNVSGKYSLDSNHSLGINYTRNYLERNGDDKVNEFNQSYESPNFIKKHFLGYSYSYLSDNEKLDATLFGKQYWYSGKIITYDHDDNKVTTAPSFASTGYGTAISYDLADNLLVKSSFEKAYRIPESYESLGDGIYILPNPELAPEESYNLNAGVRYRKKISPFRFNAQVNGFFRDSRNFIRLDPQGPFGTYENLDQVRTEGVEGNINVNYNNLISLNTNLTYQNITERTRYDEGLPNVNYKSRVPNIPYLFGNARLGVHLTGDTCAHNFTVYWTTRYVHEFFLTWANQGNPATKRIIPSQLTHNAELVYSGNNERYNASLTVRNITDAIVYDNFSVQKPGRAFYLKLRYFLK